jgi:hypothetical protein
VYVEGREKKSLWFSGRRDDGLRWEGNSWTSGNCTLRDEKEPTGRRDGLRWEGNSLTSGNCTLRDEKKRAYGFLGEEMVYVEGEQLDEWQLYVEGRERCHGLGYEMVCLCCVGRGTA